MPYFLHGIWLTVVHVYQSPSIHLSFHGGSMNRPRLRNTVFYKLIHFLDPFGRYGRFYYVTDWSNYLLQLVNNFGTIHAPQFNLHIIYVHSIVGHGYFQNAATEIEQI